VRVAAYIRVGGTDGAFAKMLETEKVQFEAGIKSHDNWEFAGCYADSCPVTEKRPELMRLLDDCRAGEIDIIVTKSTSRISKKPMEIINIALELAMLKNPVGIYFMEEDSYTLSSVEIFCLGGLAAIESEKQNQKGKEANDDE
jgi:DNA invertase Pin-like site-specific DNA recombinase